MQTAVTDVGIQFLNGNGGLETLDIRGTQIAGAGLKFLLKAKKLKLLRTEQSKVDPLTLNALRKALPECVIQ
jgi:hypothetical protein